jgi:dTDP-4-amino-4,6-dideoxygalactose transaminase
MKLSKLLAIDGGTPTWRNGLESYKWITKNDLKGLKSVAISQKLSGFLGQQGPEYLGGNWVQKLESEICKINYAVTFNSWTSGLEAIFLSLDLEKDSEIIVPAWTMSATISAIINAGYVPKFIDISEDSFTIKSEDLSLLLSRNTRAVCSVELFGRPSEMDSLRQFCNDNNLVLISDSAQCPGAKYKDRVPSKWADVGGYSLNRHKHFQTGEGGIAVTDNYVIAERLRALRNHGEVAAPDVTVGERSIYGHNWRMGELEAYLGFEQYKRFVRQLNDRRMVGKHLSESLKTIEGLSIEMLPEGIEHDYYLLGMRLTSKKNRRFIEEAIRAEGLNILITNYSSLHKLPAFAKFSTNLLPNAEKLNDISFIGLYLAGHIFKDKDIKLIKRIFERIFSDPRSKA